MPGAGKLKHPLASSLPMRRLPSLARLALLTLALAALSAPTTTAASPPLAVLVVPAGVNAVQVTWAPSPGAVLGYHVFVMDDNRVVTLVLTVPPSTAGAFLPSGSLDYGVASFDGSGMSAINWYTTCVSVRPPSPYVYVSEGACP